MKPVSLFLVLSILYTSIKAQNNYVEVVASDTVLVTADRFIFQVMAMPDMYAEADTVAPSRINYMRREREMRLKQKQVLDALEAKLKAAGFAPLPTGIQDMMASRGFGNYFLTYQINTIDALNRFQRILKEENYVNAVLQSASSQQEESHQKRLYSKLMDKAKRKAENIAGISGKKITGILLATENAGDERGWNPYMPTTATRVSDEAATVNANYPVHGRLLVRFAWN